MSERKVQVQPEEIVRLTDHIIQKHKLYEALIKCTKGEVVSIQDHCLSDFRVIVENALITYEVGYMSASKLGEILSLLTLDNNPNLQSHVLCHCLYPFYSEESVGEEFQKSLKFKGNFSDAMKMMVVEYLERVISGRLGVAYGCNVEPKFKNFVTVKEDRMK